MKLTEMKRILAEGQIALTKSMGQNFLHDGNQLRRIVDAAELTDSDRVLEIGPGLGPLTELLASECREVLSIEMDKRLYEWLGKRFGSSPVLKLVHADALKYLRHNKADWSNWKVVSNLPYSVASPILVEFARSRGAPRRIVVTLQWEVANRILASAGKADYGILTLLIQSRFIAESCFKIPAPCFFPPPDVDSACVTLARRSERLVAPDEFETFDAVVKLGFSQRRKMMMKLLKARWPKVVLEKAWNTVRLPEKVRAEEVTLEQFAELSRLLEGMK